MDKHLAILAKQHMETRFVKINAEKSPYLSEKLRIVVLPTLALVKNAKVEDYVVSLSASANIVKSQFSQNYSFLDTKVGYVQIRWVSMSSGGEMISARRN